MSLQTQIDDIMRQYGGVKSSFAALPHDESGRLSVGDYPGLWQDPTSGIEQGTYQGFNLNPANGQPDYDNVARSAGLAPWRAQDIQELATVRFGGSQQKVLDAMYGAGQWEATPDNQGMIWVKPNDPAKASKEYTQSVVSRDPGTWLISHPEKGLIQGALTSPFGAVLAGGLGLGLGGFLSGADALGGAALAGSEGASTLAGSAGADTIGGGAFGADTVGGMSTLGGGINPYTGATALGGPMSTTGALSGLPAADAFLGGAAGAGAGLSLSDLAHVPTSVPGGGSSTGNIIPGETGDIQVNPDGTTSPSGTQVGQTTGNTGTNTVIGPATTASQLSAFQKILNGTATAADYAQLAGQALPGLIGAYQSSQQTDALRGISEQARNDRLPFLNAGTAMLSPDWYKSPEAMGSLDAIIRKLSVGGNVSDPAKLGIASTALNQGRVNNAATLGAVGTGGNIPALQTNAVTQSGQTGANIGSAVSNVFNPQQTLAELLKSLNGGGFSLNAGGVV